MNQKNPHSKVQITIHSTQHDISEETTENIYTGKYRFVADKHVVNYEEYFSEEGTAPSKTTNLVKIGKDFVHISKKGTVNTQMHFQVSKKHQDIYRTPFGNFDMTITTHHMSLEEKEDGLTVNISYSLGLNHCPVSKCTIQMQIKYL